MTLRNDTPEMRKARGAFFTPPELTRFMSRWAVRDVDDRVLEPSCGDAAFLLEIARAFSALGVSAGETHLHGYDIHRDSLTDAAQTLTAVGARARLSLSDFFETAPTGEYNAVVGNPPFIRFQGFNGPSRALSIRSARAVGVELSGLASSWAGFVVHGTRHLRVGGRLAFVLPAELLSVSYAGPVREYLLSSFASLDLIVFDELVFSGIQADVVVLLADGFGLGSSSHFRLHAARNASSIDISAGVLWSPREPKAKWTDALSVDVATSALTSLAQDMFVPLSAWGRVSSGLVTGANAFFVLNATRVKELGLADSELVSVLPPGSLSAGAAFDLAQWRRRTPAEPSLLFRPAANPSPAGLRYIAEGEAIGLDMRYKCRVRSPWWRVPRSTAPDLFVSYMSGTTPRLVSNDAKVLNLNSVHGLEVAAPTRKLARTVLPLLALSSASLFAAELVGRSYGGGVLKLEPSEAGRWLMPSPDLAQRITSAFPDALTRARRLMATGDTPGATAVVDEAMIKAGVLAEEVSTYLRNGHLDMVRRRVTRAASAA